MLSKSIKIDAERDIAFCRGKAWSKRNERKDVPLNCSLLFYEILIALKPGPSPCIYLATFQKIDGVICATKWKCHTVILKTCMNEKYIWLKLKQYI